MSADAHLVAYAGMKIERIELWHVDVPLPAPFHPSWIPGFIQTGNRFTLIRLRTASGIEGWSAAPAMGREREGSDASGADSNHWT